MENTALAPEQLNVANKVPQPTTLLAGLILLCTAAHFTVLARPVFTLNQTFIGGMLILLSVALISYCMRFFPWSKDPLLPFSPAEGLVTTGVYRISRNPMYLGMIGILGGVTIIFGGSYLFLLALVAFIATLQFTAVMPEEVYLEAVYGEAYASYKARVHQWL